MKKYFSTALMDQDTYQWQNIVLQRQFIDYHIYERTIVYYEVSIASITVSLDYHIERHVGGNTQDMPYMCSGGGVVGGKIQYNQRIDGQEHTMEK